MLICPICRVDVDGVERAWPLASQPGLLRCKNPSCVGRYTTEPFPIIIEKPGEVVQRLIELPDVHVSALGLLLHSLPRDSVTFEVLTKTSAEIWTHYHDLLPNPLRPEFVHPAPFAIRALALLDEIEITSNANVLVAGASEGREALEIAHRLVRTADRPGQHDEQTTFTGGLVVAADIDPAVLTPLRRLCTKGSIDVALRSSINKWHTAQTLELPVQMLAGARKIQPICCDVVEPPSLHRLLRSGGHLMLATAFDWDDAVTPEQQHLSAAIRHARLSDVMVLEEVLTGRSLDMGFQMQPVAFLRNIPRTSRTHDTHFTTTLPHVSLWKKTV